MGDRLFLWTSNIRVYSMNKNQQKYSDLPEQLPLLPNTPADLTKQDIFNSLSKGNTIRDFIKTYQKTITESKMLALFGEWGSGKTTILKYLEKELCEIGEDFQVVFFEAWKYEKDGNLPLSLLDVICEKLEGKDQLKHNIMRSAYTFFKAFAKSTSINLGVVSINNKVFIEDVESEAKIKLSYYKTYKEMEENFQKIEDELLGKEKKLIVFVDDLDRCEPENILNLLSAIKLFFTYGKRTIYFCGIDKEAVNKAVEIKYGDIIKSGEYLEKIFDISFNMPMGFDLSKLLNYYFSKAVLNRTGEDYDKIIQNLALFFNQIGFTNPRHLKKVLNKYLIVQYCKINKLSNHQLIPEISIKNDGSVINIIFVLYFIVLYEFYPSKFRELEQYGTKIDNYKLAYFAHLQAGAVGDKTLQVAAKEVDRVAMPEAKEITFDSIARNLEGAQHNFLYKLLTLFTPNPKEYFNVPFPTPEQYLQQFESPDEGILVGFCYFLLRNIKKMTNNKCNYPLWRLFEMAKTIL